MYIIKYKNIDLMSNEFLQNRLLKLQDQLTELLKLLLQRQEGKQR